MAVQAIMDKVHGLHRYPDGSGYHLKLKLSEKYNVSLNQIILGNGSNELIELITRTFLSPGEHVVQAFPTFLVYEKIVKESEELMRRKCEEKRKAGILSKVHEESHMTAVATFGAATARALIQPDQERVSLYLDHKDYVSSLTKIAGFLHDCEREATEIKPHGPESAKFVLSYWLENWKNSMDINDIQIIYNAIKYHEGLGPAGQKP